MYPREHQTNVAANFRKKPLVLSAFISIADRSEMWPWMEALAPGPAGRPAAITTAAAPVPVCVGRVPAIALPLSAVANSARVSMWR